MKGRFQRLRFCDKGLQKTHFTSTVQQLYDLDCSSTSQHALHATVANLQMDKL
jgi:hypothetical protein